MENITWVSIVPNCQSSNFLSTFLGYRILEPYNKCNCRDTSQDNPDCEYNIQLQTMDKPRMHKHDKIRQCMQGIRRMLKP